jgi:hypothetical protein
VGSRGEVKNQGQGVGVSVAEGWRKRRGRSSGEATVVIVGQS